MERRRSRSARWTRTSRTIPEYLPALITAAAEADVVIGSRYLSGVSVVNWPLHRIVLSTFANRYIRAVTRLTAQRLHQRLPLLAARGAGAAAARRDGVGRLRLPRRDAVRGARAAAPHRRGADHLRRAAAGPVEAVLRRHARVGGHAVAAGAASADAADAMRQVVVMVTTSYPRFPGDSVGTFMEPIAHGVAARGHEVHVVAPWHPLVRRPGEDGGVHFHFFRYAPDPGAERIRIRGGPARRRAAARRGVALPRHWRWRPAGARRARSPGAARDGDAWPLGGARRRDCRRRGARRCRSSSACTARTCIVAETHAPARAAAGRRFARRRRDGVQRRPRPPRDRARRSGGPIRTVPYGVDVGRFRPDPARAHRAPWRVAMADERWCSRPEGSCGRKASSISSTRWPSRRTPCSVSRAAAVSTANSAAGETGGRRGASSLPRRARRRTVGDPLAAADVAACRPCATKRERGRLPQRPARVARLGDALVTTAAGGIQSVVTDDVTGLIVPERDSAALAAAIGRFIAQSRRTLSGSVGPDAGVVEQRFGWERAASAFEAAYARALAFKSSRS